MHIIAFVVKFKLIPYIPVISPPLFWGCSHCTRSRMLADNERMGLKLFGREIINREFQRIWTRYLLVTDGLCS